MGEGINSNVTIRFLIGSLDVGGTETHLSRLLPELRDNGFNPYVITLTHKGMLAGQLEQAGISVYEPSNVVRFFQCIPILSRLTGPVATLVYLVMTFVRVPADITCFYLPSSYYLGMIAAMTTGNNRNLIMFRRSLNDYQQGRYLLRQYEIWLHKRVTMIVGNSQAVLEQMSTEESVPAGKLKLIYNGVSSTGITANAKHSGIREELDLGSDVLVMTIVANLIPYKGHADLIRALSLVKNELTSPWVLLAVGSGIEGRQDLLAQVSDNGLKEYVYWLGLRQDVAEIYADSDIGLLLSHQESFSNAVLEGMAAGLPMIVTNTGGNAEAILQEECGLVIEPHSPDQIATAILKLAEEKSLRDFYGNNAKFRVGEMFNNEQCLENYMDLFNSFNRVS